MTERDEWTPPVRWPAVALLVFIVVCTIVEFVDLLARAWGAIGVVFR